MQFGTTGINPAYEANQQLAPLFSFVQMRKAYFDANLGTVHVFDRNSASSGPPIAYPIVTGVCPQSPVLDKELSAADAEINSTSGVSLIVQTLTLTEAAKAVVSWIMNWGGHAGAAAGNVFTSYLTVNGSDIGADSPNSKRSVVTVPSATWQMTQAYSVPVNLIAGANTVTLKAKRIGAGNPLFADRGTRLTIDVPSFLVQRQTFVMQGTGVGPQTCVSDPTDCCTDTGGIPSGDYGPLPIPCVRCTGITPTRFTFTAADFSLCIFNGQQIDPNGDWRLDQFDGCKWSGFLNGVEAELTSSSSGTGRVWTLTIGSIVYTLTQAVDPDDCCSPITVVATSSPDGVFPCVEYPNTLTLYPFCPDGSGGPPSGSGSGGGPGTIATVCCPTILLPETLCVSLAGSCACLVGTYAAVWDPTYNTGLALGAWVYGPTAACGGDNVAKLVLWCTVAGWELLVFCGDGITSENPTFLQTSATCDPVFGIVFPSFDFAVACCPGNSVTATVALCTGGGGGDGDPQTPCCVEKVPATLYFHVSNVSGCAALAGVYAAKWVPAYKMWFFSGQAAGVAQGLALELLCSGTTSDGLLLSGICDLSSSPFVTNAKPVDGTCGPPVLLAYGPFAVDTACCTGSILVTVSTVP